MRLLLVLAAAISSSASAQTVIYVEDDALPGGDGTSWATAFNDLQRAFDAAAAGDEIWVAAGTYVPSARTEPQEARSATFALAGGVELYGGFRGTEASRDERDPAAHVTILSGDPEGDDGDIGKPTPRADNVYHVVTVGGGDVVAILDGFTITGGYAHGADAAERHGGGLLNVGGQLRIAQCTFERNSAAWLGGAIANLAQSRPTIVDCLFAFNTSDYQGGAIANLDSEPVIEDCRFQYNRAERFGAGVFSEDCLPSIRRCAFVRNWACAGAGVTNIRSSATLTDCSFRENTTMLYGGGMLSVDRSQASIVGCTFTRNITLLDGGGVLIEESAPVFRDCVFEGNRGRDGGGARFSEGSSVSVFNCVFRDNHAQEGGGVAIRDADVTLTNCILTGNEADALGGAVRVSFGHQSALVATNCTIAGNTAARAGGVSSAKTAWLANCILWANQDDRGTVLASQIESGVAPTISFSCVQGYVGPGTSGNVGTDPLFVRTPVHDSSDLRLRPGSPCIDAGNNDAIPPDVGNVDDDGDVDEPVPLDLAGNPRRLDDPATPDIGEGAAPIVDMGAYEFALPGDGDFDFDVDLADYLAFVACITGPGVPVADDCWRFDLDLDNDVDLADLVAFQAAFTGAR